MSPGSLFIAIWELWLKESVQQETYRLAAAIVVKNCPLFPALKIHVFYEHP